MLATLAIRGAVAQAPAGPLETAPIALRGMGSFHIGGRSVEVSGKPVKEVLFTPGGVPAKVDPNGVYLVESMYVQYFLAAKRRAKLPRLMWHGGGLTGVTYETTPDGREGWLNYFVRRGYDIYNSDAVERGRSGWSMYPDIFPSEPVFLTRANPFERFRIGAGAGSYDPDPSKRKVLPGSQFPVEAYDNFVRQNVPRWTSTDKAITAAYLQLVEKVCPCVVLVHSQAGQFGLRVAEARPDLVRALVLVEPAGLGDKDQAAKLKDVATLSIFGDFIDQDARWPAIRKGGIAFLDPAKAQGGIVDVIDLPAIGIKGNSHMMMMDKNSDVIAGLIHDWLIKRGIAE